jgi:hypothetical protein
MPCGAARGGAAGAVEYGIGRHQPRDHLAPLSNDDFLAGFDRSSTWPSLFVASKAPTSL